MLSPSRRFLPTELQTPMRDMVRHAAEFYRSSKEALTYFVSALSHADSCCCGFLSQVESVTAAFFDGWSAHTGSTRQIHNAETSDLLTIIRSIVTSISLGVGEDFYFHYFSVCLL